MCLDGKHESMGWAKSLTKLLEAQIIIVGLHDDDALDVKLHNE